MASYYTKEDGTQPPEDPYYYGYNGSYRQTTGMPYPPPSNVYLPHPATPQVAANSSLQQSSDVRVGAWETGLCGCCTHAPNCLTVTFCQCITMAQISSRLRIMSYGCTLVFFLILLLAELVTIGLVAYRAYTFATGENDYCDYEYWSSPCMDSCSDCFVQEHGFNGIYYVLSGIPVLCGLIAVLFALRLRTATRKRFQLPGDCCCDCCVSFCCTCCSLAQVATHIKSYRPGSCDLGPVDALPAYSPEAPAHELPVHVPAAHNVNNYAPAPPPYSSSLGNHLRQDQQHHEHAMDIQAQRRAYNTPSTAQSTISRPSTTHSRSIPTGKSSSSSASRPSTTSSTGAGLWEDPVIVAARIPFSNVQLIERLSQGGNGEVYRGVYRDRAVAVKMLLYANRKDMKHINAFLSEIKLAATLDHPNIVQFVGVAWESLSELYSVAEFADGGDLRTLLTHYKDQGYPRGIDSTKLRIAMEVAHALTYMHSLEQPVLHRDLKSRNILLTAQLQAKVTDFGASQIRMDRTLTAGVGTCLWMAPEVVMGERYDEKADVFSFGAVLSELDTNELPYEDARHRGSGDTLPDMAVMQLVLMGKLRLEFSSNMHPELLQLAHDCIETDPKRRPTAAEAAYRLSKVLKAVS